YYLNPVARMYMREATELHPTASPPPALVLVLVLCVVGVLATGLMPEPALSWATDLGRAAFEQIRHAVP
ncbi:MAG: hypothetical protein AB1758_33795, partial [Candidatus Eremiobacterota bacterium]